MRRIIDDAEFWQQFTTFKRSAWRFEQQPAYDVGYEQQQFADFLAGRPKPPTDNPELAEWLGQIRRHTADGKTIGRVRVHDEPPTDYQRWMRWLDRWNREAGETIDYLTRDRAREVGLIPAAGPEDWWLFDDELLMVMVFDERGRRVRVELTDEDADLVTARRVREQAIDAARGVSDQAET